MSTLSKLRELENKHDGAIPADELDKVFHAGVAAAHEKFLRFHKRDLKRSIDASEKYRLHIAGSRYDSISPLGRLERRARLCHDMVWSAKNYVSCLAQDVEIAASHNATLQAAE